MRKLIATAMIAWCAGIAAQEREAPSRAIDRWPQALGVYANSESTGGLSWQAWFGTTGVQAAAGAIYMPYGDYATLDYNIQASVQFLVYGEDFADWISGGLYFLAHAGHRGFGWPDYTPEFFLGAGIGCELILFQHFSGSLEFSYMAKIPFEIAFSFGGSARYRY
jgi:hypothetical protein